MTAHQPGTRHPSDRPQPIAALTSAAAGETTAGARQAFHDAALAAEQAATQRLGAVLDGLGDAFHAVDGSWRITHVNSTAEARLGRPGHDLLGRVIWHVTPREAILRRRCEEVLATGVPASCEIQAPEAPDASLAFRIFPHAGGLGVVCRVAAVARRAEDILRENHAQLSAIADNLPLGMVYQMNDAVGFEERRFLYISASCERLNGVPAERALENPQLLYDLILPEHREPTFLKQSEAHRKRKPFDIEFAIRHARTGEIRWQRIVDAPRRLADGTYVWDGIQTDITDHKRAEEHLHLLINELNHRVKNTLATVQCLAVQSFPHPSPAEANGAFAGARQAFEARLFALARGHDVLTRENWEGAPLVEIVRQTFAPYRRHQDGSDVFSAEGPDLRLPPAMALSLSMALHELSTNALKHGALKVPDGRVEVSWSVAGAAGRRRLVLRWQERNGPTVSPPARRGFGSRLIEDGLSRELSGTARLAFAPEGVRCLIDMPLFEADPG